MSFRAKGRRSTSPLNEFFDPGSSPGEAAHIPPGGRGVNRGPLARPHLEGHVMEKGRIFEQYRSMSPEDQRTFNRWVTANAVVGLVVSAALVAMAVVGANSERPRDAILAAGKNAPELAATDRIRN